MKSSTRFQPWEPDQPYLLPPNPRDWLPEGHLVYFLLDLVDELDLRALAAAYSNAQGGRAPYDVRMMALLLLYAYCVGVPASRRIERATYESLPFRVLTADQHPDHDTIAEFRRGHLEALKGLFVQVLRLCRAAGLVRLGHVALDGTKMRAHASKHKAMSYDHLVTKEAELAVEVDRLLAEAEAVDAADDARLGKGVRGDELPKDLQFKQARLAKIREAKRALEAEARAEAERQRAEQQAKQEQRDAEGQTRRGKAPNEPSETPQPKAQRNFTDPDSRIMKDGATKSFEQCYNGQLAVDDTAQIIVAQFVTQEPNDKQQLQPAIEEMKRTLEGDLPRRLTADSGYFSEDNIRRAQTESIDLYVATGRLKHGETPPPAPRGRIPQDATVQERMARKLRTIRGRATYSKRKATVEPVNGQIKQARGFRQFLLRGVEKVRGEFSLMCTGHNLLKLFRSGWRPQTA